MKLKTKIIINTPRTKVWQIFSQLETWPQWSGYIKKSHWISHKKWQRGSNFYTYFGPLGFFGFRRSYPKILYCEKGRKVTWAGTGKLIRGVHTLEFISISKNKTKVVNREYFEGFLAPFLYFFIKPYFIKFFRKFNQGLKKEVEKE